MQVIRYITFAELQLKYVVPFGKTQSNILLLNVHITLSLATKLGESSKIFDLNLSIDLHDSSPQSLLRLATLLVCIKYYQEKKIFLNIIIQIRII